MQNFFFDRTREEFDAAGRQRGICRYVAPPNPRFVCRCVTQLQTELNCSVIHDQKPAQYHVNLMFTPKPGIFKNGTNYNFAPNNPISSMLNILSLF